MSLRLYPGNADSLQAIADARGVSRERWINEAIEAAAFHARRAGRHAAKAAK